MDDFEPTRQRANPMDTIDNDFITLWIEEGIMYGKYKPGKLIDLAAAKRVVSDRLQLCSGKDYPSLTIATDLKGITKEARDYFSSGDGIRHMIRLALITGSPIARMVGNFWLQINKPELPTRMFNDQAEAVKWLGGPNG